jgi:hypothetical protein
MIGIFSAAHALTQEELVAKLKSAGYSQIGDTPEGPSVKTMKNGKQVSLVVDSSGRIKERNLDKSLAAASSRQDFGAARNQLANWPAGLPRFTISWAYA